jgi:two-component system response regulator DegU
MDASRTTRVSESLGILVVDDFAPFRESLHSIFRDHKSLTIIGEAADGVVAIEMAVRLAPHVIIMDVIMPRMSGIEATRRIKRILPDVHVIGVSTLDDTFIKESMKAAGSSHFVMKDAAHTLPDVISRILQGRFPSLLHFSLNGSSACPYGTNGHHTERNFEFAGTQ